MSLAEQSKRPSPVRSPGGATFDLLPMVFAQAAVAVLPVEGAGLSMTDHPLRIPLAASDQHAVTAKRLQTTLGEGPCLAAVAGARPMVAELAVIAARWPTYRERLVNQTPCRSVASLPLRSVQRSYLGALDMYSTSPATLTGAELEAVNGAVATRIADTLFTAAVAAEMDGTTLPTWMSGEQLNDRLNVWVAIGMSMAVLNMSKRRLTRPPPRLRVLPQPHPRPSGATCHRQEPPTRGASRLVLHDRTRSGGRDSRRTAAELTAPSQAPTPPRTRADRLKRWPPRPDTAPPSTVAAAGRNFRASARPGDRVGCGGPAEPPTSRCAFEGGAGRLAGFSTSRPEPSPAPDRARTLPKGVPGRRGFEPGPRGRRRPGTVRSVC
jgi:hypothetical protein